MSTTKDYTFRGRVARVEMSYKLGIDEQSVIDGQVGDVIISKAMQSRDQKMISQPRYEVRAESSPRSRDTIQQSENKRTPLKQRAFGFLGPAPRLLFQ